MSHINNNAQYTKGELSSKVKFWVDRINSIDIEKFGVRAAIIILTSVVFISSAATIFFRDAGDFYAFYTGATLLTTDKDNLYNPQIQSETEERLFPIVGGYGAGFMAFINLPISAALYTPFLLIPPRIAERVSQALSYAVILWVIYRLYKFHKINFLSWTTFFTASLYPIQLSAHLGQIGSFIFWAVAEMYIAFMEKKTTKLGVLASLLFLKFQYLPFIIPIFTIYREKKKFILASATCILLLALVNYMLVGNGLMGDYISLIVKYIANPNSFGMDYKYGIDIYAFFSIVTGGAINSLRSIVGTGVLILLVQLIFFIFLSKNRDSFTIGSDLFYFSLILSLVMTPHSMPSDFVFVLIPLIGLLPRIKKVWLYIVTVVVLDLLFYLAPFGTLWVHTILLLLYMFLLGLSAYKNPGFLGRKVHAALARENLD